MAKGNLIQQWWRQLCFDVPRVRSHVQSRRRVLLVLFSMAVVGTVILAIYGPMAWFEYRFGGGWWALVLLAVMYLFAFSVRRWMKRRGNTITLSLASTPAPGRRDSFLVRRRIVATMVNRAALEVGLRAGAPLKSPSGGVRAGQLQALRKEGIWDQIPLPLRTMLAAPEGSWGLETTGRMLAHLEFVDVLNWIVSEETPLATLGKATEPMQTIRLALTGPVSDGGNFLRSLNEVDQQRGPTMVYLNRLHNELVKRGEIDGVVDEELEEHVGDYMRYAASIGDADVVAEDLPLGGGLVREASTPELYQARGRAAVRIVTLDGLRDVLTDHGVGRLDEVLLNLAEDAMN